MEKFIGMAIKCEKVTTPARKHTRSENPRVYMILFNRSNSPLIRAKSCTTHSFSFSKLSSEMDLDASTMTNKSILVALQGTPRKLISGMRLSVGGAVGIATVGARVGRLVGAAVVLIKQLVFGHEIPAAST
jgi:hypothetical protein